jgi:hypothetical protein
MKSPPFEKGGLGGIWFAESKIPPNPPLLKGGTKN